MKRKLRLHQIFAAVAANIGAFGLGTVLSWSSSATYLWTDPDLPFDITPESKIWIGSILHLGATVACLITGFSMEVFGRKNTLLLFSVPFVLGWLLVGYCRNLTMLLLGRLISGFCGGGFSVVSTVYIGEFAESDIRGALSCFFQLMVVTGIEFVYIMGKWAEWQWLSLVSGFVPLVFLIGMIFVPESPRYLLMHGKTAEAAQSLCWFRGQSSVDAIEEELLEMKAYIDDCSYRSPKSKISQPQNLRPCLIMLTLMIIQQLTGINSVIFYTVSIFETAGSEMDSTDATIVIGAVQVVATLGCLFIIDRVGRRTLLIVSEILMSISLSVLGVYFKFLEDNTQEGYGWLPLVCLIVFITAFGLGCGAVPFVLLGELLPFKIKGMAASLTTMFNWIFAFLVTKFFNDIQLAITLKWWYWSFAILCALSSVFVAIFLPETKKKSLEQIQRDFGNYNKSLIKNSSLQQVKM